MNRIALTALSVFVLLTTISAQNSPSQSFDNLKKVKLQNSGVEFWYNPAITTIYDIAIKNADKSLKDSIPYYSEDEDYFGNYGYIIAKTKISPKIEAFVVYISSWDEGFRFCRPKSDKELGALWPHGHLVVPGTGAIYTKDQRDTFVATNKYEVVGDTIIQVKQPFYYIGFKSKTIKEVKIYDSKEKTKLIATLPPNYEIEIILAENEYARNSNWKEFYLVKTSFGLCGWAELEYNQDKAVDVENLFTVGD